MRNRHLGRQLISGLVILLLAGVLVSCGGGEEVSSSSSSSSSTGGLSSGVPLIATGNPSGSSALPAVEVTDLATGTMVDLSTLAPAEKSILLWFYAPH